MVPVAHSRHKQTCPLLESFHIVRINNISTLPADSEQLQQKGDVDNHFGTSRIVLRLLSLISSIYMISFPNLSIKDITINDVAKNLKQDLLHNKLCSHQSKTSVVCLFLDTDQWAIKTEKEMTKQ